MINSTRWLRPRNVLCNHARHYLESCRISLGFTQDFFNFCDKKCPWTLNIKMCWWNCHWCQHGLDVIDATTLLKMLKKPSWCWWRPTSWSWSPHTLRCVIWCLWSPTACTWYRPWWNCTLQALEVIIVLREGWWWCMVSPVVKWHDESWFAYHLHHTLWMTP